MNEYIIELLIYLIVIMGGTFVFMLMFAVLFIVIDYFKNKSLIKKIPKDNKELKKPIDPYKFERRDKEDIIKNDKFREFERLRRELNNRRETPDFSGIGKPAQRSILQNDINSDVKPISPADGIIKKRVIID